MWSAVGDVSAMNKQIFKTVRDVNADQVSVLDYSETDKSSWMKAVSELITLKLKNMLGDPRKLLINHTKQVISIKARKSSIQIQTKLISLLSWLCWWATRHFPLQSISLSGITCGKEESNVMSHKQPNKGALIKLPFSKWTQLRMAIAKLY